MPYQNNSHKLIYLAEDNQDDRNLFLEAVRELRPEAAVKAFGDGQELLENLSKAEGCHPEIIFMDINMPRKNGFEALKEIREGAGPLSGARIIMLSTSRSMLHIEMCYRLEADFYAVKPDTFQELKALLDEALALDWSTAARSREEFFLSGYMKKIREQAALEPQKENFLSAIEAWMKLMR
ncbi:response regulator [Flavobacterium sp. HJSW_4]|uniref:response regulator n=1 Tax=Flavobacterium sp. HJSW_4 TaxID=3344660 RepID=UPI0035F4AE89